MLVGASLALAPPLLLGGRAAHLLTISSILDGTTTTRKSGTTFQQEHAFALSNNMLSFTHPLPFPTMSLAQQQQTTASFWDQPFAMQPFIDYYEITNVNVAGGFSLVIGAIYLFSFMYYHYILEQEQSKAALVKLESKTA